MQTLLALLAEATTDQAQSGAVVAPVEREPLDSHGATQGLHSAPPSLEQLEGWLQQQQELQGLQLGARESLPGVPESDVVDLPLAVQLRARQAAEHEPAGRQPDLRVQTPQPQPQPQPQLQTLMPPAQETGLDEQVRVFEPRAEVSGPALKMPMLAEALGLALAPESSSLRSGEPALLSPAIQPQAGPVINPGLAVEVRPVAAEARWGEQMLAALREQVEMQVQQRSQQATIRLDPPELGSLDIQIQHEQGKLSVQINAAQADVARLLNLLSERLRNELMGLHFTQVEVQVGADAEQGRQGRQQLPEQELVRQAQELPNETAGRHGSGQPDDVLISV
ncbi:hypothetical protein BVH74_02780 [Halopseudomonas phragmitis]|uniref:Flagellar hook-length control protein-like C-terminal domain-containing protein n=2 Tax=Halopseudomonas phragmitis TaxID=1931241 RepID=A0A1V0B9Y3_9GAMM|nr:hypothetical protein BVH74_02780 [Halopseudomonas phragmitis]